MGKEYDILNDKTFSLYSQEAGEPMRHDPEFTGPVHNRSCTDVFWLILFIVFLCAWGWVGYYSIQNGNVPKLLAPIDYKGRRCGIDSGVENKPYLVFFDIRKCLSPETAITGCPTTQVCVSQCPSKTVNFDDRSTFESVRSSIVCTDDIDVTTITYDSAQQHINNQKCTRKLLSSQPVLLRCIGDLSAVQCENPKSGSVWTPDQVCVKNAKEAQESLTSRATALDTYVGWIATSWVTYFRADDPDVNVRSTEIVNDLVATRWFMLGALFVIALLCMVYIVLLRWVVGPVVWITIVCLPGLFGFAMYKSYENYQYYKSNNVNTNQGYNLKSYAQSIFIKHETWLGLLIVLSIISLIYVLLVIFLRKRIVIAIAFIKEGSKAVTAIKSTVLFPLIPWIIECAVIAYALVVLIHLMSIGESDFRVASMSADKNCHCKNDLYVKDYQTCDPVQFSSNCFNAGSNSMPCGMAHCHFTGFKNPDKLIYAMHFVNLLGFFWTIFFVSGVADMILASTFATWYWTYEKKDLPFFTLSSGIQRTLRYHLGTVALGSLIIAIIRVIRVVLEYVDRKLKKFDNPCTRCLMCMCKCFFWCLETFMKFINKNAYIMCAVQGTNFCKSARDAFSLLMRNIIRVVVLDKVTDFIFFISKVVITVGVGFAVNYIVKSNIFSEVTHSPKVHYSYIPAIILSIAAYLICTVFFKVYDVAVDTLFLCFLEDCERHDGSPEKKYYMSKNLMKILGKKNKRE